MYLQKSDAGLQNYNFKETVQLLKIAKQKIIIKNFTLRAFPGFPCKYLWPLVQQKALDQELTTL